MASPQVHDVLIIGGGPSGLAIATGLARQLHTAIVFDSNIYRNRMTSHMHNVITWDHQDPREFRWKAREDIVQRYDTISFKDGTTIESVRKNEAEYFEARDSTGEVWLGRKLALAMGVRDVYPKIEGYGECWGSGMYVFKRQALSKTLDLGLINFPGWNSFNCLFCHGYEDRGCNSAGILAIDGVANPKVSLQLARMAKRLAKDVTVYTNGSNEVGDQISAALSGSGSGIKIINSRISKLAKGPTKAQVTITFEDGNEITEGFLVRHHPSNSLPPPSKKGRSPPLH